MKKLILSISLLLFAFIGLMNQIWANIDYKTGATSQQQTYDQHVATIIANSAAGNISDQFQQQQWATPQSPHTSNIHLISAVIYNEITADSSHSTDPAFAINTFQQVETNGNDPPAVFLALLRATKNADNIDPNKLNHIFGKVEYNLDDLVKQFGSQEKAFNAIQNATQNVVKNKGISGVFETSVKVGTETVTVRGNVVDGVTKIGTVFK